MFLQTLVMFDGKPDTSCWKDQLDTILGAMATSIAAQVRYAG